MSGETLMMVGAVGLSLVIGIAAISFVIKAIREGNEVFLAVSLFFMWLIVVGGLLAAYQDYQRTTQRRNPSEARDPR